MEELLISSFKILFVLFMLIPHAFAVQIEALYTSLCQRQVGITLFVDKGFAYFLNTDGALKKVPRYQVLSVASYPLDHFPLHVDVTMPKEVPQIKLWTLKDHELTLLGHGFILGHNQSGFQLLTLQGHEVFISNESIWKIEVINAVNTISSSKTLRRNYTFSHPQRGQCVDKSGKETQVYPTDLISDPVAIKRKFDAQTAAFNRVKNYAEVQSFYAVPQIYKNSTSIGYWLPLGNRYGSSSGRVAGLAPLIRNEYSQGPFSFQHLSLTGAGPIPDSIHEESQTMIFYGFKSSYIHFAGFIDPSLILAGVNYQWQEDDLSGLDERAVEASYISLGFDRGPFSITFFLNSHVFGGFSQENQFIKYTADMFRLGLTWRTAKFGLNFNTSISNDVEVKNSDFSDWDGEFKFMKLSANYELSPNWKIESFYFSRIFEAEDNLSAQEFQGSSRILGLGTYHHLNRRWMVGTRLSLEETDNKSSSENNKAKFLKSGLHTSMNF